MNKKGFTLIELLATIAILVLMSLIIGVNITSILRSTEKQNDDFDKKQIEKAACVYVDSSLNTEDCLTKTGTCEIKINKLILSGLLDDSYKDIENNIVTIKWEDNEKICIYD